MCFGVVLLAFVVQRSLLEGLGRLRVEGTIKKVQWAAQAALSLGTQFLIINKQPALALPSGPQIVQYATRESRQGTRMETVGSDYSFKISLEHVGWRYTIDWLYNCIAYLLAEASPYCLINMDTPLGTWGFQAPSTKVNPRESCVTSDAP